MHRPFLISSQVQGKNNIVEAQQVYIHECSSIAHRRISPDIKRVKLSFADSTASRQQATNFYGQSLLHYFVLNRKISANPGNVIDI